MARYSLNAEPVRFWIIAPLLALALFFVPAPPWVVDKFYSRDMYPWLQTWFTSASNLVPFAVLDVLILLVTIAVGWRLIRLFNVTRERGVMDALWEGFRRTVRGVSIVALLFLWGWGCNYRRMPIEKGFPDGQVQAPTADVLKGAISDANALASRLRHATSGKGLSYEEVAAELPKPMNEALQLVGRPLLNEPGRPKYSMVLTPFFTRAGITGMVNPFALESIVHPDLLPFERPFVVAHEWAHLAGQADEAEANAVGWLACMRGGPHLAYSASLFLIAEAAAGLSPEERKVAMARLDAGVASDLRAIASRMKQTEDPTVSRTANRVYDEYLKANRVADGATSYRRALMLILSPPLRDALSTYGAPKTN